MQSGLDVDVWTPWRDEISDEKLLDGGFVRVPTAGRSGSVEG